MPHDGREVTLAVVVQVAGQGQPVRFVVGLDANAIENGERDGHGCFGVFGQQSRQTSRCVSSGEFSGGGMEKTTAPMRPQFGHLLVCLRAGVGRLDFVSCWLSSGRWGLSDIPAPKRLGDR
jgi:hypothetical protein